jgi:hypothetical protein
MHNDINIYPTCGVYKVQDYIKYKFKIRTLMFFTSYMKGLTYCSYVEYMYSSSYYMALSRVKGMKAIFQESRISEIKNLISIDDLELLKKLYFHSTSTGNSFTFTLNVVVNFKKKLMGLSWSWSYGNWIYNYLCSIFIRYVVVD